MQVKLQNNSDLNKKNLDTPFKRLVYLIKKSPYIPAEVARELKVSESTVGRWLNGETKRIKPEKCKDYAKKLRLDVNFVATGSQESLSEHQFQKEVSDIDEGLTVDDLPRLIRERDELQRKIDRLVHPDES